MTLPTISLLASQDTYDSFVREVEPILDNYCYDCHGLGVSEGGVTLDEFTEDSIEDHELWMRVVMNTRAHVMPPQEELLPTDEERQALIDWIKAKPFSIDPAQIDPGPITVQRLNREEYKNTIRDLMGVDFDVLNAFPADDSGEGFDNIGDVLTISPMLLEKYFDAANAIVEEAVPTKSKVMAERVFKDETLVKMFTAGLPEDEDKDDLQLSFYTPSKRMAKFEVDHTGSYELEIQFRTRAFSSFRGFDYNECRFIFQLDGETLIDEPFVYTAGKTHFHKVKRNWEAGSHTFSAEVIPLVNDQERIKNLKMEIEQITIRGPEKKEHWVKPSDYERFFPGEVPDSRSKLKRYTRDLLTNFTTRAFRRPADNTTINRLTKLAENVYSQDGFTYEQGISQAMIAVLASPSFLFREEGLGRKAKGESFAFIDEYALASRLSYFLWSTMPDEELFSLAEQGQLRKNLDAQIDRMIADQKFDKFIENFGGQWFHARDITSVNISDYDVWLREYADAELLQARKEYSVVREIPEYKRTPEEQATYDRTRAIVVNSYGKDRPDWSGSLKRNLKEETERYFEHVIKDDRSLVELLDSDYAFLNEELAKHYGIEGVKGDRIRKVTLEPDSPRGGVLTQGTILAYTSNPTRTSPVKRGVFILENILGTPPAPAPPNVPALEDAAADGDLSLLTLRESLAKHREQPLCSSCHNRMDPLGLALENFNAMGMWRESEMQLPIDSKGVLITGEQFETVQEMKHILATERKRDFYYCVSEKLLTYALGRSVEYYDTETIDQLVHNLEESEGRPSALIKGIINSDTFQKSRSKNLRYN